MSETTTTQLVGPNGEPLTRPTIVLTPGEAALLRQYKKFLNAYGLKEALYCDDCWDKNIHHGCQSYVTESQIGIICRCKVRFFQGYTI